MVESPEPPVYPLISDYIFFAAERRPRQLAMALRETRLTYADCAASVRSLSHALIKKGVRPGDRVAMLCTPRPEFFLTLLAAVDIGAIWIGMNPRYRIGEMKYVIADCQPKLLFSLTKFEDRDYTPDLTQLAEDFPEVRLVTIGGQTSASTPFTELQSLGAGFDYSERQARHSTLSGAEPALIIYTSGTTGQPKGALLSHHGLVHSYVGQLRQIGTEPMIDICNLPVNHIGCIDLCCMPLVSGGTIHFVERFDAEEVLRIVEREHVTFLGQVPTIFQLLADSPHFESTDLSSLKSIMWSGSAMPRGLVETYRRRTNAQLMVTYGLTEAISAVTYSDPDADTDTLATTIGKPDPHLDVRLVSAEGSICGVGKEGEIQVRSTAMMMGYFNRQEATAEVFAADGYLRTGDVAVMRADGNLILVGRLKEMFKSGGYNVYPREIELCLESHGGVAMAAVVSVPDAVYQEVGHAYVVPNLGLTPTSEELMSWCRKHLANYKVPKRIVIARSLPMLSVGKIDKQMLRLQAQLP